MEKTLYLNENNAIIVKKDGPSLWIKEGNRAGRRVPVRLIGQVVIRGNIMLESAVITLLTENGIPVSFISCGKGSTATTMSVNPSSLTVRNRLLRLARSEAGQVMAKELFSSWSKNLKLGLIKKLHPEKAEEICEKGIKAGDLQRLLNSAMARIAETGKRAAIKEVIEGLFHELLLKRIMELELDPHVGFIHPHHNFGLVKDFCYAIEAERDRQMMQFFESRFCDRYLYKKTKPASAAADRGWTLNSEGMKNLVVRFENRKKITMGYVEALLDDFFGILRESLYEK